MHIMIDIETLAKKPNAVITQLGAVLFDPEQQTIGDAKLWNIDVESSLRAGCVMDASTVIWWMEQEQAALRGIVEGQKLALPLKVAMEEFSEWATVGGGHFAWSHGATFDLPIVEWSMSRVNVRVPWLFYNARDTRTLFALTGVKKFGPAQFHSGVKHDALADAHAQVKAVIEAYKIVGAHRFHESTPAQQEIKV